ncbi:MAG TPA: biopolymer transporter ExbD [Bryobacteraceae bacterium]|nr:biopolymer transporter ExbD [Bryobacteraceae bacterium]
MSMAVGGKKGALADINITPMIDVLLVLIIIFMVITPLTPRGLETLVPQPTPPNAKQDQSDQRTVVIQVLKDHTMKINQEETVYTEQNLGPRLEDIFKTRAERVVFVRGDPDLEYQYVARAIDIAHGAGIDKVGLMTAKMEAGQ